VRRRLDRRRGAARAVGEEGVLDRRRGAARAVGVNRMRRRTSAEREDQL
jgi:hypothetical protein